MNNHQASEKDFRFKIANREALLGIGLVLFNFIWWFAFAYGLGGKDPSEYTYVFGLPAWFFYSCLLGVIVMSVLVFFVVKRFFTDVSFDEEEYEDQ
ncbi:YhdT family protein [Sediminibacillus albus]|uniref:YhdT family protein n=1 Tax=Sediminibacillus albus TaxID=407036 RepID=UPI001FDEF84D|nr:YhdT family protein [Sediminibacillus albus]